MIKRLVIGFLLLVPMLLYTSANAQEEEPTSFAYTTYFDCDVTLQARADEIMEFVNKPTYDKAVEDGDITAWGWLAHHTGGKWRRGIYTIAPDLDALLDAQSKIGDKLDEIAPEAGRAFGEACPSHVDYIWSSVKGVGGGNLAGNRGDAGFSVYMVCDISKEDRADEIVKDTLGPIYDKHVGEDGLTSWGWLQHIVGGKIRRVLTMTAKDHKTLLKTLGAALEEIDEDRNKRAATEFTSICSSHQDYMWNVKLETP